MKYIWKTSVMKINNSKFRAFAFIILVSCINCMLPLSRFVEEVKHPVSWCVFPFLLTSHVFLSLFWFGIIYINSDIPFMQYHGMYQIIRTGRIKWVFGNIAGVFIRSFLAASLTAICSILPLLPSIEWTNEWGKVFRTIASTGAAEAYRFRFRIYYEIFNVYTPLQLICITILVVSLIATFLAMLMYVVSVYMNRAMAVAAGTLMCIMMFLAKNVHVSIKYKFALFIPAVWAEVAGIATPDLGYYWLPPLWYMFLVLLTGICICTILVLLRVKHMELDWVNEDC